MSYLLEDELRDRVSRYLAEAEAMREVKREPVRVRVAHFLRAIADRLEPAGRPLRFEQPEILLHGRKN